MHQRRSMAHPPRRPPAPGPPPPPALAASSSGSISLSNHAFKVATGLSPDRVTVQWQFVDCGSAVDGPIYMTAKAGSSATGWAGFSFSNSRQPIKEASIDGQALERDSYNTWVRQKGPKAAQHSVVLKATNGQSITATVSGAHLLKGNSNLGVQFS